MKKWRNKKWSKFLSETVSVMGNKRKKIVEELVVEAPTNTELKEEPNLPLMIKHKPEPKLPYNNENRKFWVEEESGLNCFMLYARDLAIAWMGEKHYWHWYYLDEKSDAGIEVAELLNVCWLDVHGIFDICNLSPNTMYEIVFIVMMIEEASGFVLPVNIRFIPPDGESNEHQEELLTKPRGEWIELNAGEFYMSPDKTGEIEFSLFEHDEHWKNGLIVEGVLIRPKKIGVDVPSD